MSRTKNARAVAILGLGKALKVYDEATVGICPVKSSIPRYILCGESVRRKKASAIPLRATSPSSPTLHLHYDA